MRRIEQDIKTEQFQNLYLLFGEEDYLKLKYKNKLISSLVNEGDTMNFSVFKDGDINSPQIIDQAETMPFLAKHLDIADKEYRVIVIENFCSLAKSKQEPLLEYIKKGFPDSTILIFVEKSVDKRGVLYKTAKAAGRDIEINMLNESDLAKWIGGILKENGKQMKVEAWKRFLSMTNESMNNMEQEADKLISYVGDRQQITLEDVEAVCISGIDANVFHMINAIHAKDLRKTLDLYQEMLAAKEPPMKILFMIIRQFRRMLVFKELSSFGDNVSTIARKTKERDFAVESTLRLARNFSNEEIEALLLDAATFEKQVKTGLLDEKLAVELLIMKYAGN